jgi:hypothetical protein
VRLLVLITYLVNRVALSGDPNDFAHWLCAGYWVTYAVFDLYLR